VNAADGARVLLVRALEEAQPEAIPPEARIDALAAAGSLADEHAWLARRARYLLDGPLAAYRPLLDLTEAAGSRWLWLLLVPFGLGLFTNYLGPSGRIHALYNPVVGLVLWNLAVYAAFALHGVRRRLHAQGAAPAREPRQAAPRSAARALDGAPPAEALRGGLLSRWLLGRVVPGLWVRLHRAASGAKERSRDFARVARVFWLHWLRAARGRLALSLARALHLGAISIAIGAVAGLFVRGLVLEYDVVWRSTFVRDPETVARLLRVLLGPAAWLLGHPLPDAAVARALMTPDGVLAADWIWLYAASVALFVLVPRGALAIAASFALRARRGGVQLDLGEPYFRDLLAAAGHFQLEDLKDRIRSDVRIECAKFAEGVAVFVAQRLYDERLVPRLEAFRREGGRLDELEQELGRRAEDFGAELEEHLPRAQRDFEAGLARSIERTLGAALALPTGDPQPMGRELGSVSLSSSEALGASVGAPLGTFVGAAVSGAVALVVGTVSGGFGKALGAAILVGLLHTTGPIGFLVGALGGLLLAVAGLWAGRQQLEGGLRKLPLPGAVVRAVLRESRFERIVRSGRESCLSAVRERMQARLEPLTDQLAAEVWKQVKPVLGARLAQEGRGGPEPG
jgi:Protein of unknown function (DUF2868)